MTRGERHTPLLVPGATARTLDADHRGGRLRYLQAGTGKPLVLLHTVRTQAEHFHRLVPMLTDHYAVHALDLPGMGHSEIVPGARYEEADMRAGVERLLLDLDLTGVTIVGESMGAVLALTTAAALPDRVERVVAVNPYDYAGGITRSGALARLVVTATLTPGVGAVVARAENRLVLTQILKDGLVDRTALSDEYVDELVRSGDRPGYARVARAVFGNLPSLMAARSRYAEVLAPVHLVHGEHDWSRPSDRSADRELLPDAEHTEVAGAGHFIALERPDVIADLLTGLAG